MLRSPSFLSLVCAVALGGCLPAFEPLEAPAVDGAAGPGVPGEDSAGAGASDAVPGEPTPDGASGAAAAGALSLSFVTTANGGEYAPRNIVAVWVEDGAGGFVKTIGRWAATRRGSLRAWSVASGSDTDAVSGATRPNHTPTLTATWDLRDRLGAVVPDGTYTIRIELADRNASLPTQNRQGTFTFVKGPAASTQTVAGGGFLDVVIDYAAP